MTRLAPLLGGYLLVWALSTHGGQVVDDEGPFLAASHRLLHGEYAQPGTMDGTKFLWHGPGIPALIAPLVSVGAPLMVIRLVGPLLLFAAAVCFYRLLRLRLSRGPALIGAYALGLYGPMYQGLTSLQKEPLALALSILALYGTARYVSHGQRRFLLMAGLGLGALAMTRLEYGWVICALLASAATWWLVSRLRHGAESPQTRTAARSALVGGVGMLMCVPWLAYTYSITHHVLYWGNSGGISLYWMSSPAPGQLGEWHASHTVFADPRLAMYRPLFHYLDGLSPLKRDLALTHLAVVQAETHPAKYTLNLLANVSRMFLGFPFSFTLSAAVMGGLIAFNSALLAGVVAAVAFLRRARHSLPAEAAPFFLFAASGLTVHLFTSAEPRFLIPLIPVPVWLISHALNRRLADANASSQARLARLVGRAQLGLKSAA